MEKMQSVLFYNAKVWADSLDKKVHRKPCAQVQRRGALRASSAYRTISELAVMVVGGVIFFPLLAREGKAIYNRKNGDLRELIASEKRQCTLTTHENLDPCLNRMHGEIDYFHTKFLNGHEAFGSYLHKIGKTRSSYCVFISGFMRTDAGEVSPDSIVREILRSAGRCVLRITLGLRRTLSSTGGKAGWQEGP